MGLSIEEVYDEDEYDDVTQKVEVYQNGKTFTCACGHGIGTFMDTRVVRCHSCKRLCIDKKADERKPPKTDNQQSQINDW